MDKRSNELLKLVLRNSSFTVEDAMDLFDISERSVKKLIKELNLELQTEGLPQLVIDREDNQVSFSLFNSKIRKQIKKFVFANNYYTYRLSKSERHTIIVMILLNRPDYITAAQISDHLSASRNTVISDLTLVKEWLHNYDIELISQVQKGYKIKGDESNIRQAQLKLLQLNLDELYYEKEDIFQLLLLKELDYQTYLTGIERILYEEEEKNGYVLSDYSFFGTMYELLVLVNRWKNGFYIEIKTPDKRKKSSKYPLSKSVMERMETEFGITVPEEEKKRFVESLRKKSYVKSDTRNVEQLEIPIIIGDAIHKTANRCNISFYLDFSVYNVLVDHMKSAVSRLEQGESLKNSFTDEIESKYPAIFQIVDDEVQVLEQYLKKKFSKDEKAFLVLYFASLYEKEKRDRRKNIKIRTAAVGTGGRGMLKYLVSELEKLDDILEIFDVRSRHDSKDFDPNRIDLIVSTVELDSQDIGDIPCVLIQGPILRENEIYKIRREAQRLLDAKIVSDSFVETQKDVLENAGRHQISYLLSASRMALNDSSQQWEEAVGKAGEFLYHEGFVKEEYIRAMIENIKENGTYLVICPEVVIPHAAIEDGFVREGISLVRLKKAIDFGDRDVKKIRYVFGLSLCDSKNINHVIYSLSKIFCNPQITEALDLIQNPEEFLLAIKKIEEEIIL